MSWRFLSERESERGGGLTDPFVNPERDVRLEATADDAGSDLRGLLRDGAMCRLSLVDLYRSSLIRGEVTHDCAGGGFRAYSCSSRPVHKV